MRDVYQKELESLQAQYNTMFSLAYESLKLGVRCEKHNYLGRIDVIVSQLSTLEKDIFHSCELIILKQQPVAGDLDFVTHTIKQILDLRRIGELSLNSAKIIIQVPKECLFDEIKQMSNLLLEMFASLKVDDISRVKEIEDIIDSYFKLIKEKTIEKLYNAHQDAHWWLEIFMLSKCFEKIADHINAITYA